MQNLDSGTPFIYLDGNGCGQTFHLLAQEAMARDQLNDLYILNACADDPKDTGITNTFDPINPLVGDGTAFEAIFGVAFGEVLNQLCLCEHQAGRPINFDTLSRFIQLKNLVAISINDDYLAAKTVVDKYINHLALSNEVTHDLHARLTAKAAYFIECLEHMPMCSFNPDLDFESIYTKNKYLYVLFDSLENSKEKTDLLRTLIVALASKAAPLSSQNSPLPSIVVDSVFERFTESEGFISRLSRTNTLFSYYAEVLEGSVCYGLFEKVTNLCQSFLIMKCETNFSHCLSNRLNAVTASQARRVSVRDVIGQGPGSCAGFGHIIQTRRGMKTLMTDPTFFQMSYRELSQTSEEFRLSSAKLVTGR
jgi:hypothetical protein